MTMNQLICFSSKSIDDWTFDVFALSEASAGAPLRYMGIDLLNRYGVIHKYKVSLMFLFFFFQIINLAKLFKRTAAVFLSKILK